MEALENGFGRKLITDVEERKLQDAEDGPQGLC
jgi:hypothetical protein